MGDWGIKVSKEGYDVMTADDKDLSLKSGINIFKVKYDYSGTIQAGFSSIWSPSVGIIPFFLAFMEDTDGKMRIVNGSGFVSSEQFVGYANATNVILINQDPVNDKKYYLYSFYDPQPT